MRESGSELFLSKIAWHWMENLSLHLDMSTVKFLKYIQEVVGNTTQKNCKDHVATCKSDQHRCQVGKHYKHTHTHTYMYTSAPRWQKYPGICKLHKLPRWLCGKESACQSGDMGSTPGSGSSHGEEKANPSSVLAWEIPWTEEPKGLQSMGSQRVQRDLALNNNKAHYTCKEWM